MNENEIRKIQTKLQGEANYLITYFNRQNLNEIECAIILNGLLGTMLAQESISDEEVERLYQELKESVHRIRKENREKS